MKTITQEQVEKQNLKDQMEEMIPILIECISYDFYSRLTDEQLIELTAFYNKAWNNGFQNRNFVDTLINGGIVDEEEDYELPRLPRLFGKFWPRLWS